MKGLEISIIKYSQAISKTGTSRWDSEYYFKRYLQIDYKLSLLTTKSLQELSNYIKKGIFDLSPDNYLTQGVPLIRTSEIKNPLTSLTSTVYISNGMNQENSKTILMPDDLVFTKIGAYIGDVSLLPKDYPIYNFSQNVAGVSLKDKTDGPFILSFFLSKWGKQQILRSIMLSGQGKLELEDIRKYRIPIVSKALKDEIANIFEKIEICNTSAKKSLSQAQELLQSALSLSSYSPVIPTTAEKSLRESFIKTGRIDAEYYQPKYDFLFAELQKFECKKISDEYLGLRGDLIPDSLYSNDSSLRGYIRGADIAGNILTNDKMIYIDSSFNNETIYQSQTGDIILSLIGSVGCSAIVLPQFSGYYISNNLGALRPKYDSKILPEYLQVYLSSNVGKMLFERWSMRTAQPKISMSDILSFPIPILPMPVQQQIADLIRESFALRDAANQLLAEAKQLVETTIENM